MSNTGKKLFPHCEGATSMARKVRNAELDSRSAREKLRARGKPYFRTIEKGLHLGYRKLKGKGRALTGGKWVLRHYVGEQTYEVETIATADDLTDADGVAILDYWQAQTLARERMASRARKAAGKGPVHGRRGHRTLPAGTRGEGQGSNRHALPGRGDDHTEPRGHRNR
jgi:hypothetical protein